MKLFKKVAAAAVAAALAFSMVGCGAAVSQVKQDILDIMHDEGALYGQEYKNTTAMDNKAQKLLDAAAEAYDAAETPADVGDLLNSAEVRQAAGFTEDENYLGNYAEYHEYKSGVMPDYYRQMELMQNFRSLDEFGNVDEEGKKIEVGIATREIGGKSYVVVLMKAAG